MSNSQLSVGHEVKNDYNGVGDDSVRDLIDTNLIRELETYFNARIDEVDENMADGKRSVFDFVDMAVLIGALANATDTRSKNDTDQYIDFVKHELISAASQMSESHKKVVATAFYCLMRCGLVHEMSLGAHKIRPARKQIIKDYSISITHDESDDGSWYSIDTSAHEITFYAHALLKAIKFCVRKCFDGNSQLWCAIRDNVNSHGIKIISVKPLASHS